MERDLTEVIEGSESLEQCAIDGSVSLHVTAVHNAQLLGVVIQ